MEDVRRLPAGESSDEIAVTLDELARGGARRMIATALEAEVADYVERCADERGEDGKRLVVRNGRARQRKATPGRAGARRGDGLARRDIRRNFGLTRCRSIRHAARPV